MAYYICPVCRSPKKANLQDKLPGIIHFRIFVSLATLMGMLTLGGAGPWVFKLALLYLPIWGAMEFVHWVEQKAQTKCRTCDFDPFLYQKDWRQARVAVESRLNSIKTEILASKTLKQPTKQEADAAQ